MPDLSLKQPFWLTKPNGHSMKGALLTERPFLFIQPTLPEKKMRLRLSLILTLISIIVMLPGCHNKGQPPQQQQSRQSSSIANPSTIASATPDDGVRRISVEDARKALAEDRAIILDVRGTVEYELGHIKGARLMPLGEIARRASELPREKLIVTYCACKHEGLSGHAVQELQKQGIENTSALVGGLDAWTAAGLPTESTSQSQ
jgi:rhodanese-related sulfurtransferase